MYTSDALSDLHTRAHLGLQKLLDHCAGFSGTELSRQLDGFGYPCVRLQLHHVIGAEEYWIGVLHGLMLVDEREEDFASIESLRVYRERVAGATAAYLREASVPELNTRRRMTTWGGQEHALVPAHVLVRTQMHIFQHQGQVAAMCRLLGRPIPAGLDFTLL